MFLPQRNQTNTILFPRSAACLKNGAAVLTLTLLLQANAAGALLLNINPDPAPVAPGGSLVFTGTITNTTGNSLVATDLFLNLGAYDPAAIAQVDQLLGLTPFTLPNNTFLAAVELFRVTLQPSAPNGAYSITATLQDVVDNLSDPQTATINVAGTPGVPEPSAFQLSVIGACTLFAARAFVRRRSSTSSRADHLKSRGGA